MAEPFKISGKTVAFTADTSAPTAVAVPTDSSSPATGHFRFHNAGSVTVHIGHSTVQGTAQTNAAIPTGTGSNSKTSFPLPAGAVEVLSFSPASYFSGITASSTAVIYITPGEGV